MWILRKTFKSQFRCAYFVYMIPNIIFSINRDECHHVDMMNYKFDPLNYILCDVDNESLFYPSNVVNVSNDFKTHDKRTKFRQQQFGNLLLKSKNVETICCEDPEDNLAP